MTFAKYPLKLSKINVLRQAFPIVNRINIEADCIRSSFNSTVGYSTKMKSATFSRRNENGCVSKVVGFGQLKNRTETLQDENWPMSKRNTNREMPVKKVAVSPLVPCPRGFAWACF
ncbi:MAG: hypothetical protein COA78_04755 [Blastopirellula sp.]|nr:MAG: hypothetical protein COA78_04755 [Blastopirellula sp.]